MKSDEERIKHLHILPANADSTYWFIKTILKANDAFDHVFLVAANEKTILKRYTTLYEFIDAIKFLVGGTEGSEGRRRYKYLKSILNSSDQIIWHGLRFDTIDTVKVLYKKKKILEKSVYIAQTQEFYFESSPDNGMSKKQIAYEKKHQSIVYDISTICYSDDCLVTILAEKYGIQEEKMFFTPYVSNPDFLTKTKKILSKLQAQEVMVDKDNNCNRESLEKEDEAVIEIDENTETEKTIEPDETIEGNTDNDIEQECPLRIQFDYGVRSFAQIMKEISKLPNIFDESIEIIVPNSIWIQSVPTYRLPLTRKQTTILSARYSKKIFFKNASYSVKDYYEYLEDIDIILVVSDIIINPIYLYACIMANKVFIISKMNYYYDLILKSGCRIILLEEFNVANLKEIRDIEDENKERDGFVREYFSIENILKYWEDLFRQN